MTDPFTTARNDIAGLPGHGMSADVQVAEQQVGEAERLQAEVAKLRHAITHAPIIGYDEDQTEFRERQDVWLLGTYREALATPKPADLTTGDSAKLYRRNIDGTFSPTDGETSWSMRTTGSTGSTPTSKPADPTSVEGERVKGWRQREVQMIGAAISTRNWHDLETAYNQLRDKIDRALSEEAWRVRREALATNAPDAAKREDRP